MCSNCCQSIFILTTFIRALFELESTQQGFTRLSGLQIQLWQNSSLEQEINLALKVPGFKEIFCFCHVIFRSLVMLYSLSIFCKQQLSYQFHKIKMISILCDLFAFSGIITTSFAKLVKDDSSVIVYTVYSIICILLHIKIIYII